MFLFQYNKTCDKRLDCKCLKTIDLFKLNFCFLYTILCRLNFCFIYIMICHFIRIYLCVNSVYYSMYLNLYKVLVATPKQNKIKSKTTPSLYFGVLFLFTIPLVFPLGFNPTILWLGNLLVLH